jgi:hypothetical protein
MDKDTQQTYQRLVEDYNRENGIKIGSIVKQKVKNEGGKTKWIGPFTVKNIKSSLQNNEKTIIITDGRQHIECDMNNLKADDGGFMAACKTAQRILTFGAKTCKYLYWLILIYRR